MTSIESLIDALELCAPQLDPAPLCEDPPTRTWLDPFRYTAAALGTPAMSLQVPVTES